MSSKVNSDAASTSWADLSAICENCKIIRSNAKMMSTFAITFITACKTCKINLCLRIAQPRGSGGGARFVCNEFPARWKPEFYFLLRIKHLFFQKNKIFLPGFLAFLRASNLKSVELANFPPNSRSISCLLLIMASKE